MIESIETKNQTFDATPKLMNAASKSPPNCATKRNLKHREQKLSRQIIM